MQDIVAALRRQLRILANPRPRALGKAPAHARQSPLSLRYDPRRILVGDVDGDGLADLVYVDDTEDHALDQSKWQPLERPIMIQGTPPVSDIDAGPARGLARHRHQRRVVDGQMLRHLGERALLFLDFTGGMKPYLLNEMDNNMGADDARRVHPFDPFLS